MIWSLNYTLGIRRQKGRFCGGWSNFVKDNDLKVGDVCVFVLSAYNGTKGISFDVVINRKNSDAELPKQEGELIISLLILFRYENIDE